MRSRTRARGSASARVPAHRRRALSVAGLTVLLCAVAVRPAVAQPNSATTASGAHLVSAGVCAGTQSSFTVNAELMEWISIQAYHPNLPQPATSDWARVAQSVNDTLKIQPSGTTYVIWAADWNGSAYDLVSVQTAFYQIFRGDYYSGAC